MNNLANPLIGGKLMNISPSELISKYENGKWSQFKNNSTRELASQWHAEPRKVMVFIDSKLNDEPLVMLRKSQLEELTKTVDAFISGEAVLRQSLEAVFEQVSVINELIDRRPDIKESALGNAISVLTRVQGMVQTVMYVGNEPKPLEPHRPDPELTKLLPEDD